MVRGRRRWSGAEKRGRVMGLQVDGVEHPSVASYARGS